MFANNNMLFVMLNGKADALGDLSATNTSNTTFAGAGMAVGFAAAAAVAKGTSAAAPYTDATTAWLADGGYVTASHTGHMSIDFPYGPTPVSVSVSMTSVMTHGVGGLLSAKSFRLRTFLIRGEPFIAHAFVRALMRTAPCWKSFQLRPRARETRATSWA